MKLCVPIVNRTNYSKLRPILPLINSKIDVSLILSSSILLEKYGYAYADIENDSHRIDAKIDTVMMNDSVEAMSKSSALAAYQYSIEYARLQPDAVLVVGDRFDMLSAVVSARFMNIPMLHIQGGERSGSVDDYVRDMITVCSNHHYVATKQAYSRVKEITHSDKIFYTGCPAVESLTNVDVGEKFDPARLKKQYKDPIDIAPGEQYLLVMIHPNTENGEDVDMSVVLDVVFEFPHKLIVFYPNVDALSEKISMDIRRHKHIKKRANLLKHAPFEDFAKMMAHCSCMVTNSSVGIREAASYGVPVVNVGSRQQLREKNNNTIDAKCIYTELYQAISSSLDVGRYDGSNVYYRAGSATSIALHIEQFLLGD